MNENRALTPSVISDGNKTLRAIGEEYISTLCRLLTILSIFFSLQSGVALAEKKYGPGATDTEIKIGQTMPYSGPNSAYGTFGRAEAAYFKMINDQGGINGRKINFLTLDDAFSPPRTVEQVRKLVEQEQVLLLFQTLGTATNSAIHKYVNAKKVPHLFVSTGATKWGDPEHFPWTMGWQPNYQTEAHIYAKYLLQNKRDARIAVLYANDDFGKDYLKGLHDGLGQQANSLIVKEASYEFADPTVDSQIVTLQSSGADTLFIFAAPKAAAQAIRKVSDVGWKPLTFLTNVSSSVAAVLEPAGLEKSVGLITALYLKDPTDPQWEKDAAMKTWREWMKKYYPDGNTADILNVYGYAAIVGYSLHQPSAPPSTGPLQNLTAASFANPLILLIVSLAIGALFGFASNKLSRVLAKKA